MDNNTRPDIQPPAIFKPRGSWLAVLAALFIILIGLAAWSNHHNSKNISASAQISRRDKRVGDVDAKFNQPATVGNLKVTITKATIANYSDTNGVSEAAAPQSDKQYLIADVNLEGTTKSPVNYSYNQFSLLSDSKILAALGVESLPPGVKTPLGSGSLSSGQKINGQIVMLLPAPFKYYYVVFTPIQPSTQRLVAGP